MKRTLINVAILSTILGTGMAQAGGFDRSGQDTSIILKEGNLLEITSVSVSPKVTGTYSGSTTTGSVAPNYSFTNIAFRANISDDMSLAVIQDEPFGAQVNWTGGGYDGVKADIKSSATTALVSYDFADNITIYGGLKSQSLSASASNPVVGGYSISSNTNSSVGYVFGGAIEKPEIAMRVALTYHSKIGHDLSVVESSDYGTQPSADIKVDTPEAFNFDFQTGVAENTLLFGNIRYVKWTQLLIKPEHYKTLTAAYGGLALKDFKQNTTSYTLGLGRKFSDQWSGAVTYGTEAALDGTGSALGPTDGYSKMGVGVTYTGDNATITLGAQQVNLGDAQITGTTAATTALMSKNTMLVTALKVGYKF